MYCLTLYNIFYIVFRKLNGELSRAPVHRCNDQKCIFGCVRCYIILLVLIICSLSCCGSISSVP